MIEVKRRKGQKQDTISVESVFPDATHAPTKRRSATTTVGVEVDGDAVHMATVSNGVVVDYRHYQGDDLAASLAMWRSGNKQLLRRSTVRVAWSGSLSIEKAVLPNVPDDKLPDVVNQRAEELAAIPAGEALSAALVSEPESDKRDAVVVAADRVFTKDLWPATEGLNLSCHPSPFGLRIDGLYLLMGQNRSLCLVADGQVSEFRYFSPAAAEDTSKLVSEMSRVIASWSRRPGAAVPDTIFVAGTGARDPLLADAIASAGLDLVALNWPTDITALDIPVVEQPAAYVAVSIAVAEPSVAWAFADPDVVRRRRDEAKRKRVRNLVAAAIGAAVLLASSGAYALYTAHRTLARATTAQAAATANVHSVRRYLALQNAVQSVQSDKAKILAKNPNLYKKLATLLATLPSGGQLNSVSLTRTPGGASVQMSAFLPGTSFAPVATWVSSMEAVGSSVNLQSYSLEGPNGQVSTNAVSVQLTATV